MDTLNFIYATAAITGIVAAALAVLLYRRRVRQIMAKLNTMLDCAIDGDFSESTFDESTLSALEAKMARFLPPLQCPLKT